MVKGGLRTKQITKISKENEPLISVISVVYNGEKNIEATIQSVLSQNYNNIEYIIIDGNSNDNTLEIIKKYSDKIDYWQSEPDKGIYDAMNKGVSFAFGDYCIFLNCGDYFLNKNVLEKCAVNLNEKDIISGKEVLENHSVISGIPERKLNLFTYMNSYIPHESTFIKTELLKKHPYKVEYRIISDYVFFFEEFFIYNSSYKTIPQKITFFKLDGISNTNRELANKELNHFYENCLPGYVLDLYFKFGGNKGCLELLNNKPLLLIFRICRKIKRLIEQKLNYYL